MTEQRAWMPSEDLEYDLAHEEVDGAGRATDAAPSAPSSATDPVYVPTETLGYDGDYGYDLAHDVPGR